MTNKQIRSLQKLGLALSLAVGACAAHADWVIGQVAPLTGAASVQGKAYAQGMNLYFAQVNRAGGVQGERVRLVSLDDRGSPEDTLKQTQRLLQESKPVALAGYFGQSQFASIAGQQVAEPSPNQFGGFSQHRQPGAESAAAL